MPDYSFVVEIVEWLYISIMIWESFLDKTVYSDVLKKNINTPPFTRLERRAETLAEEAKVETKNNKTSEQMQICKLETEEAKIMLKKL